MQNEENCEKSDDTLLKDIFNTKNTFQSRKQNVFATL